MIKKISLLLIFFTSCTIQTNERKKQINTSEELIFSVLTFDDVLKLEEEFNSKIEDKGNLSVGISEELYPYVNNYNLTYYEFNKRVSNFHLSPKSSCFIDDKTKKLKYFELKWDLVYSIDFLAISDYSVYTDKLSMEIKRKEDYNSFYNQLIKIITSKEGIAKNHKITKTKNNIKEMYLWGNDDFTIKCSFVYPKEKEEDLINISYVIYWK